MMTHEKKKIGMLQTVGVCRTYRDHVKEVMVLREITLIIRENESVAMVGPSGAGKSTLLNVLGGLDEPDQGQVLFDAKDVYRMKERERSRFRNECMGFVFQFYHLLPEFTALENVVLPLMIRHQSGMTSAIRDQGREFLKKVGLLDRAAHRPSELSGGEQQRVAIARALINRPRIVFCDEPTGNLDSVSGREIIELLKTVQGQYGATLVIVTHDRQIAQGMDRVIYLQDGRIEEKKQSDNR